MSEIPFTPESHSRERFLPSRIDALNAQSWYLDEAERQPFVALSVTSVGPSRETGLARFALGGNMSENYGENGRPKEMWASDANANVNRHIERMGYDPDNVRIIRPQKSYDVPLHMVDVDDPSIIPEQGRATWLPEQGDFIYTHDPNVVLGVRPADCPIVMTRAETPEGTMLSLTHFAWRGARAGYVDQMFERFDKLGVDPATIRMYVSPGVEPHNFPFTDKENPGKQLEPADLFVDVQRLDDGNYKGFIDLPGFVRDRLKAHGVSDYQIYQDTSDTSLAESGYSSHSRAIRPGSTESNSRGIFLASLTVAEPAL